MPIELWQGLLIPFAGTTLGAACVFFMRNNLGEMVQRALTGFAAGVMVAASIWSLLLPAMEQAADMGRWSFVPAVVGFWLGIFFLLGLDRLIPHLHRGSAEAEGIKSSLGKTTMLTLAVALHNIPEGMAVGAVYAGWLYGDSGITLTGALALSLGIAIQNFPEGAIISMPLKAEGFSKSRSFLYGTLSGAVEPIGAILTMPLYREMPETEITCLDYSPEMLERAKCRGEGLAHVRFQQGDVGALPFGNSSFDIVLSLNGFHAFPDKEAAWREIFRVLRPGGVFCGCFYVTGQNRRTDWLIRRLYVPKGYFTPPFETAESLRHRLEETFGPAKVRTVQSMASFVCRKAKEKYP